MPEKMLTNAKRIIIKIGSSILIDEKAGNYRKAWLSSLAADVAEVAEKGLEIIIVTSGAVGLGRNGLGLKAGKLDLEEKQAAAAYGQISLAGAYRDTFAKVNLKVAQVLLTPDDTENRRKHLNARSTLEMLLSKKVIPIINENDTVATEELRFGDNDRLAARVAQMVKADLVILLSDVDGLYTANPAKNKGAKLIETIPAITKEIEEIAGGAGSMFGSGGMASKVMAAKIASQSGIGLIITKGLENNPISKLFAGGKHSYFPPALNQQNARKKWIAASLSSRGSITVDAGAEKALSSGKSLLPAGVKKVSGEFDRGDAIKILSESGKEIGVGISAYSSEDAKKIIGRKSSEIESILGYSGRDELIHRDDMVTN